MSDPSAALPLGSFGRSVIGGHAWQVEPDEPHGAGGPPIDPNADPGPRPFGRKPPLPEPKPAPPSPASATVPTPAPPVTVLWLAFQRAQRAYDAAIAIATEHHDEAVSEAGQHCAKLARHHAPAISLEAAERVVEATKRAPIEAIPEAEALAQAKAAYIAAFRAARGV